MKSFRHRHDGKGSIMCKKGTVLLLILDGRPETRFDHMLHALPQPLIRFSVPDRTAAVGFLANRQDVNYIGVIDDAAALIYHRSAMMRYLTGNPL